MEAWKLRRRIVANHALKKYGLGLDHPMFSRDAKEELQRVRRKSDDITGLIVHELDVREEKDVVETYFSKFTEADTQELFVSSKTQWLLSGEEFSDRVRVSPPEGIINTLKLSEMNPDYITILWPIDNSLPTIDMNTVHQIVRELVVGLFVMNQIPALYLGANYDQSSTCHLPPAYLDTLIGQMMIAVDFMMKSLWHGAYFPQERRMAFNDSWKTRLRVDENGVADSKLPVLYEFQAAGMYDLTKEEGFNTIYADISKKLLKPLPPPSDFLEEMENVIVTLTFFQRSIQHTNGIFLVDPDYFVAGSRRNASDELGGYDHISEYIFSLGHVIKNNLTNKMDIKLKLHILKLVGALIPIFITLKRQFKIPRLCKLLQPIKQENLITERTLPPITVGPDFVNSSFYQPEKFFHLHGGIQYDVETTDAAALPTDLVNNVNNMNGNNDDDTCSNPIDSTIPILTHKRKTYYVIKIGLEEYSPDAEPIYPRWINPLVEKLKNIKFRRLPLISTEIYAVFKKFCGPKKAKNYNDLEWALHTAAIHGQVSIIHALLRLMPVTRLELQDASGLSVTHVATLYNHSHVLGQLALAGLDMNVRKGMYWEPDDKSRWYLEIDESCRGFTPLHLAARVGGVRALCFLLSVGADVNARDQNGFAAIHHAAWSNQLPVVRLLITKYNQLELKTENDLESTPLLLAAQRGALDTMVCLLDLGAERGRTDATGRNCIVLAALEYRHHILDFFIERKYQDMLAWTTLFDMLKSEEPLWRLGSVKTIEVLSANTHHLRSILDAGIPQVMCEVLKEDNIEQQKAILLSLSNICHEPDVQKAISSVNPISVLVERLQSTNETITSLASRVVYSISDINENYSKFGKAGAMEAIVNLLLSESEELLLEAAFALQKLCEKSTDNKQFAAASGGVANLVKLLMRQNASEKLILSVCAAATLLITGSVKNQSLMVQANGIVALSKLLHSTNVSIQTSGAKILGILATSHRKLINQDVMKPMVAMLKVWDVEVRINGASALWALAGNTLSVQKFTANIIGVKPLVNMLLTKNSHLIFYSCRFMAALGFEDLESQNSLLKDGGVDALVRYILSSEDNEETLFEVVKTLGILCVGSAHTNNSSVQRQIAKNDSIRYMVKNIHSTKYSEELRVEIIYTLACIVLNNEENLKILVHHGAFPYGVISKLMKSSNDIVRIKSGMALSTYAFNKLQFQKELRKAGRISFSFFEYFLNSSIHVNKYQAAFQMAILSHLVENSNPIDITARGLSFLATKLATVADDDSTVIASLMSSLIRSATGIPDGLVSLGVIELLLVRLKSENPSVRATAAITLGYLSYNRKAFRQMLKACRAQPALFDLLTTSLQPAAKISEDFIETFRATKLAGLPVVSLCSTRQLGARVGSKRSAGIRKTLATVEQS